MHTHITHTGNIHNRQFGTRKFCGFPQNVGGFILKYLSFCFNIFPHETSPQKNYHQSEKTMMTHMLLTMQQLTSIT
jgi:hypothetical protein